jgi:hypothetical protein
MPNFQKIAIVHDRCNYFPDGEWKKKQTSANTLGALCVKCRAAPPAETDCSRPTMSNVRSTDTSYGSVSNIKSVSDAVHVPSPNIQVIVWHH